MVLSDLTGHIYLIDFNVNLCRNDVHLQCDAPPHGRQRWNARIDKECSHPLLQRKLIGWCCPLAKTKSALTASRGSSGQSPNQPVGLLPGELRAACGWRRSMPVRSVGVGFIRSVASRLRDGERHSAGFVMRRS